MSELTTNLWLTDQHGYPPFLADFECKHGNLPTDLKKRCHCWDHMRGKNA